MLRPVLTHRMCFEEEFASSFREPTGKALILLLTVALHDNHASFVEMVSSQGDSEHNNVEGKLARVGLGRHDMSLRILSNSE